MTIMTSASRHPTAWRARDLACVALWTVVGFAHAQGPAAAAATSPDASALRASPVTFAKVGRTVITVPEFQQALTVAMRKKYYHAKPPEAEFAKFQRDVADDLVNRVLLLAEARRRGVKPDEQKIKATIAGYDQQYGQSATWQTQRETMLANVVPRLEDDSRLERLEVQVKTTGEPNETQARAYYDKHKDLFVEPEQVKLAVILLKVDPSSSQAVWDAARDEATRIHHKLSGGGDFAELARLHSGDRSAAQGGEMEYVHRGMLPEAVQKIVDGLATGRTSDPVQLLEGYAILRLDGRREARQRRFDDVRERVGDLWQRERGQAKWAELIGSLRRAADIRIDESRYLPALPGGAKPRAG